MSSPSVQDGYENIVKVVKVVPLFCTVTGVQIPQACIFRLPATLTVLLQEDFDSFVCS